MLLGFKLLLEKKKQRVDDSLIFYTHIIFYIEILNYYNLYKEVVTKVQITRHILNELI